MDFSRKDESSCSEKYDDSDNQIKSEIEPLPQLEASLGPLRSTSAVAVSNESNPRKKGFEDTKGTYVGMLRTSGGINFGIPTVLGASTHVTKHHGTTSWRYYTVKFFHHPKIQILLAGLLLLDVLILFAELFLLAFYPHCSVIHRDGISCCPSLIEVSAVVGGNESAHFNRFLMEGEGFVGDHGESHVCPEGGNPNFKYVAGCDEHKWRAVHTAEETFFGLTIAILGVFFLELNATMIAIGPLTFFRQFFYLLDYVIVTISLVLEIAFHILADDIYQSAAGFLVSFRIWRFLRIGHGLVEVTHNVAHNEYNELLAYTEELELILQQHHITNVPVRPNTEHRLHKSLIHNQQDSNSDQHHSLDANESVFPMDVKEIDSTENEPNLLEKVEQEHRDKIREKKYHQYHHTETSTSM